MTDKQKKYLWIGLGALAVILIFPGIFSAIFWILFFMWIFPDLRKPAKKYWDKFMNEVQQDEDIVEAQIIEEEKSSENNFSLDFEMPKFSALKSTLVVLVILGIVGAFMSVSIVERGTVGVVTRFGEVTGWVFQPGLNFKIPFVDNVVTYNTKKVIYETSDNPATSAADYTDFPVDTTTLDGQQITVRYTARFSVDPDQATWIANNLGRELEIVEKVVKTDSRIHTRNIPRQYPASDLYTGNVEVVQQAIEEKLRPIFEANGLILDEFGIRSIKFNAEYVAAIESKQIEAEKVITEQNRAEQEKFKKEIQITRAQGEAEAQRLQQQTLNDELLQKLWIEKWNGILPETVAGDSSLLLQLPAK